MISTLVALLFMIVELSKVFGANPDPNLEHLQIWSTFFRLMDSVATLVLAHLMSNAWLPAKARAYLSKTTDSGSHVRSGPHPHLVIAASAPLLSGNGYHRSVKTSSKVDAL